LEDENDSNPILPPSYSATVFANIPINSPVLRIHAPDPDSGLNGEVYYYLLNQSNFFAIHPKTGVLSVIHSLQSLAKRNLTFTVAAADRAWLLFPSSRISPTPSITSVTIVVQPKEVQLHLKCTAVDDGCTSNRRLCAKCKLSSDDRSDVALRRCQLHLAGEQAQHNRFVVARSSDHQSGAVFDVLLNDLRLAVSSVHELFVDMVCDDGAVVRKNASTVSVRVAPSCSVFSFNNGPKLFNASEALPVGAEVGRLLESLIIEVASNVRLRIVDHSSSLQQRLPFSVNENTGIIYVSGRLDYETETHYDFDVSFDVSDCNRSFLLRVTVQVMNENDNFPIIERPVQCLQTVVTPETPIDTVLCSFHASDADSGRNGKLMFSLSTATDYEDYFFLHEVSGKLYLRRQVPKAMCDRTFNVLIRCSDDGLPFRRETSVVVPFSFFKISLSKGLKNAGGKVIMPEVSPIASNRHSPVFLDSDESTVFVREDVSIGYIVAVLRAYDLDDGLEGFV
uniref:Cadherin domain-containing protein n=1 Tax=Soboliphyme baturini TaxID=241478 RepID=A0A183J8Y7_9BILA